MALGLNDLSTGLPSNLTSNVGNSLSSSLPSIPSMPTIPNVGGALNFEAPAIPAGVDPCSSLEYLKNKLTSMPLLGNLSLTDITGSINLDALTAPKIPKIPTLGEIADDIGKGISDGISGAIQDVKDGVTGIMEDLKPSNLLPNIKKELGAAGREALASGLENAMMDALGPVKGGIADRIKRSVKTNLMMAGIDEVVNILEGKPNIFNPCPGKDKAAGNAAAEASKAATGQMNMAMNTAIADQTKAAAAASTKMARDLVPPIAKLTIPAFNTGLPGLPELPELPGDPPEVFAKDQAKHEAAVAEVTDDVVPKVAKEQAEKGAKEDEKKETRNEKKDRGLPASGDNFKPVQQPGSVTKFHYSDFLYAFDMSGVFNKYKKKKNQKPEVMESLKEELPNMEKILSKKQTLEELRKQQQEVLGSFRVSYYAVFRGEIHELKSRDFINFDKAGVPETFYTGWMNWTLYRGGLQDIITDDLLISPVKLSVMDQIISNRKVHNIEQDDSDKDAFEARYPIYLLNEHSYTFGHKINPGSGMSLFNGDVLHMSGVKKNNNYPDPLYTVPLYWSSYEDAVSDLIMITTNDEVVDLMFDLQYFDD